MARDGNKLYESGDFEGAETRYRHALEANPQLEDAAFNLAGALFKQQKADEAAKIYTGFATDSTATARTLPRVADANYNLGNMMLTGQKIDEAIEFYKQALRINPGDMQTKYNLAYARKLKKEQENQDQNQDQNQDNQDRNKDNNDGGGDQNQDRDKQDGEGDRDNSEGNRDEQNGDRHEDEQDGDGEDGQERDGEPEPDPNGRPQEASIAPEDARQMLEAIQDEEDNTREKMNDKEVQAVGKSGKNW